jgi:hypothetical protein
MMVGMEENSSSLPESSAPSHESLDLFSFLYLATWFACVIGCTLTGWHVSGLFGAIVGLLVGLVVGWAARYAVALILAIICKLLFGGKFW